MPDLSAFPITRRWPPQHADRIQLYSLTTPNGIKVSTALEELGLPYDAHFVDFAAQEQMSPEFLSLNPNNKIPAIIDPDGPGGKPLALFESGAILIYLAEKTGKLMSTDPARRYQTIQWLMWQMGGLGPMFGQLGWLVKFAGKEIEDPRPRQRFLDEAERLLGVLDDRLAGRDYVMDEYSIADIAIFPWLRTLRDMYGVGDQVDWDGLENVPAYLDRCLARPASQKGITSPAKPA
ncbi:MAG: glutathione S-transferase N-terminal domain-containing protein [Rhodobacteraceae bacterium]|nr:glutathione S-transferase N-terminal domain-containing protein [Paracoccaceae bacterium]